MNMMAKRDAPQTHAIHLERPDDFDEWRDHARALMQCGVEPDRVVWVEPGGSGDLFAAKSSGEDAADLNVPGVAPVVRASKRFIQLARNAVLHSDETRFALLYRLLWRLQENSKALDDKADPDVGRIEELAKNVRRDHHKMHAFVRFRLIEDEQGGADDHYVAWFEPEHHIVRANAGFFVRRFANMKWSILTPRGSLHWDGSSMREGPPAQRSDAPQGDPVEDMWRTYYASIFNPARLKVGAMLSEMPKKYWKNLPEAALIPDLIANAQAREATMVAAGELSFDRKPDTLSQIGKSICACAKCPIGELENQAVMGEGPHDAALMIVGEQPGDQEDQQGRPFVGPAGQVLDRHLAQANIDRNKTYLTNAVKHFKFVQKGKRRIHQSPTAKEIDTCRWWLEAEREIVRPRVVLALGASAARSLLGKTVSIKQARGKPMQLEDGSELWITAHPSYLLRLDGPAQVEQERLFQNDLRTVRERLSELAA